MQFDTALDELLRCGYDERVIYFLYQQKVAKSEKGEKGFRFPFSPFDPLILEATNKGSPDPLLEIPLSN